MFIFASGVLSHVAFDILNFAVPHVFIWRFMLPFVGREFCFSAAAARFIFSFVVWLFISIF